LISSLAGVLRAASFALRRPQRRAF